MTKKVKILLWTLIPLIAASVWLFASNVAARYRADFHFGVPAITVRIRTLRIDVPASPGPQVFDGTTLPSGITAPDGTVIAGITEARDAGTYEVHLTLEDPETTEWSDGTRGEQVIIWQILPRSVTLPQADDLVHVYSGTSEGPTFSYVEYDYVRISGSPTATAPGYYECAFCLKEPANTFWTDSTTADRPVQWMIGVCRIDGTLYPSVTEAFDTELSTREKPVEMLCNWAENAVNETGTDFFSLNGFSLESDGITVENQGVLTVLGGGTLASHGTGDENHAILKNSGTLTVEDGVFEASYDGDAAGGSEVYFLWNEDGEAVISDGTVTVDGGTLAADLVFLTGGSVLITDGTFDVSSCGTNHGSYLLWIEGGEARITDGVFDVSGHGTGNGALLFWMEGGNVLVEGGEFRTSVADASAHAYMVKAGTLSLAGGTVEVAGCPGEMSILSEAKGSGEIYYSGGEYRMNSFAGGIGVSVDDGGTTEIAGGLFEFDLMGAADTTVDGFLIEGGGIGRMSGGEIRLRSDASGGTSGFGISSGTCEITGGTVSVTLSGSGRAYGVNCKGDSASVQGLTLNVTAEDGSAYGFIKSESSEMEVLSGSFLIAGDFASTGECSSSVRKIQTPVANVNCAFSIRYVSGWSAGVNWENPPYIASVERLRRAPSTDRPRTSGNGGMDTFQVRDGVLNLTFRERKENGLAMDVFVKTVQIGNARSGLWRVTEQTEENGKTLILEAAGTGNSAADAAQTGSLDTDTAQSGKTPVAARTENLFTGVRLPSGFFAVDGRANGADVRDAVRSGALQGLSAGYGTASARASFEAVGFLWVPETEGKILTVSGIKDESGTAVRIEIRLQDKPGTTAGTDLHSQEESNFTPENTTDPQDEQNTPAVSGGGEETVSDPLLLPGEGESGEQNGGL